MVKHNNVVPNAHFHKWWQRYVSTWFDQPAKKQARRNLRIKKAAEINPRPLNLLRPAVHGSTIRYNTKIRAGRGFTIEELKAAGISKKEALGIGIAVDHRRKNRSEEAFQQNVERLKLYKSKLVLFPRNPTSKRVRKGDATREERKAAVQVTDKNVLALPTVDKRVKARAITQEEKDRTVVRIIRKERTDAKMWGIREKRAKEKAEKEALKKKKKGKK
eukprot:CAMPEP_0183352644 /NCGR_PEP_ID=MMETSP0164_2-20130417/29568_1 /TAXON_ID=221442 /ORGANISM="Coccolithus pelagicus ssp braarudi, Strain PLY182g" /LENGTH=217 /DNA_ID=CAMNT_0025525125 /DNA_START=37 /DNA_END=690 /DNA_ORIENTATION=+